MRIFSRKDIEKEQKVETPEERKKAIDIEVAKRIKEQKEDEEKQAFIRNLKAEAEEKSKAAKWARCDDMAFFAREEFPQYYVGQAKTDYGGYRYGPYEVLKTISKTRCSITQVGCNMRCFDCPLGKNELMRISELRLAGCTSVLLLKE